MDDDAGTEAWGLAVPSPGCSSSGNCKRGQDTQGVDPQQSAAHFLESGKETPRWPRRSHTKLSICPFIAWRALAQQGAWPGAASGWRPAWGKSVGPGPTDRGSSLWSHNRAREKAGKEPTVELPIPGCLWFTWQGDLSIRGSNRSPAALISCSGECGQKCPLDGPLQWRNQKTGTKILTWKEDAPLCPSSWGRAPG